MPKVFLSRDISSHSPFQQLHQVADWELNATSLLQFLPITFASIPPAEWLFFYSRKGVEFFLAEEESTVGYQIAAIGPGTAARLQAAGYTPDFEGNGSPEAVAEAFGALAAGQRVVFVQARQSRQSVQKLLVGQVLAYNLVVYDNVSRLSETVAPADYLIFTSPLNFATYQQNNRIQTHQRCIAIGTTTARAFATAGLVNYRTAAQPTETALLECLLDWEKENAKA